MKVYIYEQNIPKIVNRPSVRKLVREFLKFHELKCDEVSIHFVDVQTISKLHADFFNDGSATDCISFPIDDQADDQTTENYRILGDVFVCPDVAKQYVKKCGGDFFEEMTLYVVHGLLHLLKFDDITPKDRKRMRKEEARFLQHAAANSLWIT